MHPAITFSLIGALCACVATGVFGSNKKRKKYAQYRWWHKMFYIKWKPYVLNTKLKCDDCNGKILYFCKYDAEFCPQCNVWISANCNDPNCPYCADRPETPKDALAVCKTLPDNE